MGVLTNAQARIGPLGLQQHGVVQQPTPVGPEVIGQGPNAITSGSQLNRTAVGPWPELLDAGYQEDTAYRPNGYNYGRTITTPANYGSVTSASLYQWRQQEWNPATDISGLGSIAGYPGATPEANRPTYNNLTGGAQYQMQVLSQQNLSPSQYANIQHIASQYTAGGTASITSNAPPLY